MSDRHDRENMPGVLQMSENSETQKAQSEEWIKTQWQSFNKIVAENKQYVDNLSVRQYIDATVLPILTEGLRTLVKERPSDPVEYLGRYLLENNPSKMDKEESMKSS